MRFFFILCFLLAFLLSKSQDQNCEAMIHWQYLNPIKVLDSPNGNISRIIKNDSVNEIFIHFSILKEANDYFYVDYNFELNDTSYLGWIKKAPYIGAFVRDEKFPMNLILLQTPTANSNQLILKNWTPGLITIKSCKGKWVLVSVLHDGKIKSGWIESIKLCANNYTTCN